MDAALASLLGTVVGSVAGLGAAVLGSWQQQRQEQQQWRRRRAEEVQQLDRRALTDLATLLATACQTMAWLSWGAKVYSGERLIREIHDYEDRMRNLLPKIFGAQATISGLEDSTFLKIQTVVDQIIGMDTKLGTLGAAITMQSNNESQPLDEMRLFEDRAFALSKTVVETIRRSELAKSGLDRA